MTTEATVLATAVRDRDDRRRRRWSAPKSGERLRISRALDIGAGGLVVPRRRIGRRRPPGPRWMRFPPTGPARHRPSAAAVRASARSATRTSARQRRRRRRLPDREPGGRRRRGRDRRARRRRRPVRGPGRPVALARRPWPLRRPGLPRRDRGGPRRVPSATARRPGSCSTTAAVAAAPPRARVPVHRPRLGPRVRVRRGPRDGRGRPRRLNRLSRPPAVPIRPRCASRDPAPGRLPARSGRAARPR